MSSASQASEGSSGSVGWFKKLVSTSNSKIGKMESYVKRKFFNGRDESLSMVEYIGTAVVMKKLKVLDLIDRVADIEDDTSEAIVGKHVSVQLISTELLDPQTSQAVLSNEVPFPGWPQLETLEAQNIPFHLKFIVPNTFGVPGAILVKNHHPNEFLLVSFTLDLPPDSKNVIHHAHYVTNSWVYNTDSTTNGRVFFHNKAYLPIDTPLALKELRERELRDLRGNGKGERKESDRIYDYDIYNDLGKPDEDPKLERPNLGGNKVYPFPRRMRTGRAPSKTNAKYESRSTTPFYIPRDECFDRIKNSDFKATGLLSLVSSAVPKASVLLTGRSEFESVEEIKTLFAPKGKDVGGLNNVLPTKADVPECDQDPLVFLNEVLKPDGQVVNPFVYPLPRILQVNDKAWQKNEEFAREFLAGLNPVIITLVKEFPLKSSLDPAVFGDPTSAISKQHIEGHLEGLSVEQAVFEKKLFVADYHDAFLPFVARINAQENSAQYATRAMFFLSSDGTLKVLALELVLPPKTPGGAKTSRVLTPPNPTTDSNTISANMSTEDYMWELAKAHVSNNDLTAHQVFSHFTQCHAAMEPVIIASNRQLSKLHPIYQLMAPHFVNTLEINRLARTTLISAGGSIEANFTPRQYALAMAAAHYRDTWTFESQALPNDLVNRGMAVRDPSSRHGVRLVVEDYPYAADGLELWTAIKEWNTEYIDIYYKNDKAIQTDTELQSWWGEIRNQAHADKRDAPAGWPVPSSKRSLVDILTTLQWIASCQHAAVNFGQYDYAGFMPHHPTLTRRLLPDDDEGNSKVWEEWQRNPEHAYLKSISNIDNTATALSVYEVLSTHAPNEEYIGERPADWTENDLAKAAFKRFSEKVSEVDELIQARNEDPRLKNRTGVVQMPYQLMRPNSTPGVTFRGVPNSISI